jgi:hypothetical protein
MKKDVNERPGEAHGPCQEKESRERVAVINRWAIVSIGWRWLWHGVIRRSYRIWTVSAVEADSAFAFACGPLEGVEKQTQDEEDKEFGENDVKGFLFLGSKLGFDVIAVVFDFGVIVAGN